MKKTLSLLLSLIMLLTMASLPISAYAEQMNQPIVIDRSLDSNSYTAKRTTLASTAVDTSSAKKTYNNKVYYGKGKELYNQIRSKLDSRSEEVTIQYYSTYKLHAESIIETSTMKSRISKLLLDLVYGATDDSISVTATDGDYALWSISEYGVEDYSCDYYNSSGYYYTLTLIYGYYDTAAQEAEVSKAVYNVVSYIRKQRFSDYEIIKYVHDYICNSTTYDYDAYEAIEKTGYATDYEYAASAYGALVYGKCVCQGYALAFYRICKTLGYSVRFVYSDTHAWNIIKLDGKYYFVDCTWDDAELDEGNTSEAYYYFLVNYDTSVSMDYDSDTHTISSDLASTDYYIENYANYYAQDNYSKKVNPLMSTCSVALSNYSYTYNGNAKKPAITVTTKNGTTLKNGVDYTVAYSSNVATGKATATITGIGDYEGMSTARTYVIIPQKMGTVKLKSGTRASTSLTLTWSKPDCSINGYQIQVYKNGAWVNVKKITSASTTSYKVTGLSPSTTYKFRIRAYKTIDKTSTYGAVSATTTICTTPKAASILSITTASKSLTIKWKKVACSGYQIQYSTSSNMSNAKTVNVSSSTTAKKISSLKSKKKYYVRIRSYKKYTNSSGKSYYYYASWSGKKSITVK